MTTESSLPEHLGFNGVNAADGSYRIPRQPLAEFAETTRRLPRIVSKALPRQLDAKDLERCGWAVAFGASTGDAHRRALAPLLALRREQAGRLFRDDLHADASWGMAEFLQANDGALAVVDPERLPYYLLLVGGPEDFTFDLQAELGLSYGVGRLSFETPEEYANYARSVVSVETGRAPTRDRRLEFFACRNWDDPATKWSEQHLIEPLAGAFGDEDPHHVAREAATRGRLLRSLGDDPPGLLFASCHGVNFWPNDALQGTDQGAMLCYDWPGKRIWGNRRIPEDFYVAGRHLDDATDLRGQVAFFFSCYGAGTPRQDTFDRSVGTARLLAERDLIAALPRRMLGKPDGALAVFGHVDQAWVHSFFLQPLGSQVDHFRQALRLILDGEPVGLALEPLTHRLGILDVLFLQEKERRRRAGENPLPGDERQVLAWTAHYDAFYYALLGDPAVRLPA